jgi:hypothetical protein
MSSVIDLLAIVSENLPAIRKATEQAAQGGRTDINQLAETINQRLAVQNMIANRAKGM